MSSSLLTDTCEGIVSHSRSVLGFNSSTRYGAMSSVKEEI